MLVLQVLSIVVPVEVIPVIDLLDGHVVHAVAGKRKDYAPFENSRYRFDNATDLCRQWIQEFAPDQVYVADLNAIQKSGNNLDEIQALLKLDVKLLIDFGIATIGDYEQLRSSLSPNENRQSWLPVIGSESVQNWTDFELLIEQVAPEFYFSIDIKDQKVLGSAFAGISVEELVDRVTKLNSVNIIVLDLDAVGTGGSRTHWNALRPSYISQMQQTRFFVGGGIKDDSDLQYFEELGIAGVLVSTSLHNGKITDHSK